MKSEYEEFGKAIINLLTDAEYIDHRVKRNIAIREEYQNMRAHRMTKEECLKKLSEKPYYGPDGGKYFIGKRAIEKIVYKKRVR